MDGVAKPVLRAGRRRVVRIVAAVCTGCLLVVGWVASHPPLSADWAGFGRVPGGFQAATFDLRNVGRFPVRLTGVSVADGAEPAYVLAMTSSEGRPGSIHLGAAQGSYVSGDVRRQVILPSRPDTPRTGVMVGWKLGDPLPAMVTIHYRYLGWPMRLQLRIGSG
jgi:hypothetical protein